MVLTREDLQPGDVLLGHIGGQCGDCRFPHLCVKLAVRRVDEHQFIDTLHGQRRRVAAPAMANHGQRHLVAQRRTHFLGGGDKLKRYRTQRLLPMFCNDQDSRPIRLLGFHE